MSENLQYGTQNQSRTRLTVGIIYDTSFLMLNRPLWLRELLETSRFGLLEETQDSWSWPWSSPTTRRSTKFTDFVHEFDIVEVVPVEVERELQSHFDDSDKVQPAKKARKIVAELVAGGATEVSLAEFKNPVPQSRLQTNKGFGADSKTDLLILGYAMTKLELKEWSLAIIATDDGGILYDATKLWMAKARVWCHTKDRGDKFLEPMKSLAKDLVEKYGVADCAWIPNISAMRWEAKVKWRQTELATQLPFPFDVG